MFKIRNRFCRTKNILVRLENDTYRYHSTANNNYIPSVVTLIDVSTMTNTTILELGTLGKASVDIAVRMLQEIGNINVL